MTYSQGKSLAVKTEQKQGVDIVRKQLSTSLTFLYTLQAEALTSFVLDYLSKDICTLNSLERSWNRSWKTEIVSPFEASKDN